MQRAAVWPSGAPSYQPTVFAPVVVEQRFESPQAFCRGTNVSPERYTQAVGGRW